MPSVKPDTTQQKTPAQWLVATLLFVALIFVGTCLVAMLPSASDADDPGVSLPWPVL